VGLDAFNGIKDWNGVLFFVNDFFQNVPFFSSFTLMKFKTNYFFNKEFYGHDFWQDQIVPISITGLFHLGYIGSFLYSSIFVRLAMFFENLWIKQTFITHKYLYLYLAFTTSLVTMLNVSAILFTLSTVFLFTFPLIKLFRIFK
jgi:hypothetical protein